ncbi:hypothetical protein BD560DRAFT_491468 [Blakeslea trispora]|nr:hypothetical protein BD560DRAFT_491468 [Blakeslea trispora]
MSDTAIDETQRKGSVVTSSTAFSNNRTAEGLRPRSHQQLARDQNAYEFNTTSSSLLVMTCPIKCKAFTQCMPKRFFTAEKWIEDMLISCLCLPSFYQLSTAQTHSPDEPSAGTSRSSFSFSFFSLLTTIIQSGKTLKSWNLTNQMQESQNAPIALLMIAWVPSKQLTCESIEKILLAVINSKFHTKHPFSY